MRTPEAPDHPDTIPAPPPEEHVLDRAEGFRELSALSDLAAGILTPDPDECPPTLRTGERP